MVGWLLAASPLPTIKVTCEEIGNCPLHTPTISAGLANVVNILVFLVGSLSIIFMIVGGLQMALSMGSAKRVEQGRETLRYSLIGVGLAVAAYALVTFFTGAF